MEIDDKTKKQKRNTIIWIIIGTVAVLALVGLLIWQMRNLKKAKETVNATATATISATITATKTATVTSTASVSATTTGAAGASEQETFSKADKAVDGYLTAYVQRDLNAAKPYMTTGYFATWTQDAFAGISSPSRDHYQIIDTTAVADSYQVKAKVYLKLNGEDAGTESWIIDVFPTDQNTYQVEAMNSASF